MEGKQDYYNVGSKDSIVISSSSLKYINPLEGGSPLSFLNFFEEKIEEKESKALRLGKLIHLWAEDKEGFHIGAVDKPSDKLGEVADCAQQLVIDYILQEKAYEFPSVVLEACRLIGWNRGWGDDAIKKNACPLVVPYLEDIQLASNESKIYVSKKDKEVIEACTNAILKHPLAKELLFMQDNDFTEALTLKEVEVYWEKNGTLFKAKLDDVTIHHEKKAIFLNDLKTMSSSVYNYKNFKYYRTWRQLAFYRAAVVEYCFQNNINIDGYTFIYNIIAVETGLLNQCAVWEIKDEWIVRGLLEIKDLVGRIKWHIANDEWNYQKEEFENGLYLEMPYEEDD